MNRAIFSCFAGLLLNSGGICIATNSLPVINDFYEDVERHFEWTEIFQEAMAAFRNEEYDLALKAFSRADLLSPNDGLLWHFVAQVHQAQGDEERAREVAYHLLECYFGPGGFAPRYMYAARNLKEIGAVEEALAVLETGMIVSYAKGDGSSYLRLLRSRARHLADSGAVKEAIALLGDASTKVSPWDFKQEVLDLLNPDRESTGPKDEPIKKPEAGKGGKSSGEERAP